MLGCYYSVLAFFSFSFSLPSPLHQPPRGLPWGDGGEDIWRGKGADKLREGEYTITSQHPLFSHRKMIFTLFYNFLSKLAFPPNPRLPLTPRGWYLGGANLKTEILDSIVLEFSIFQFPFLSIPRPPKVENLGGSGGKEEQRRKKSFSF